VLGWLRTNKGFMCEPDKWIDCTAYYKKKKNLENNNLQMALIP